MSTNNPFANLNTAGMEEAQDRLGGGFQARASGAYDFKIKAFYAGQADSGARNVSIIVEDGAGEYRETIYVTNKAGENWFLNKDDKTKKVPLPGFTTIDDICQVTVGKALADLAWEEKVIKLYDFDAKKELPKSVMMATEMLGQPVTLGLIQTLKNKGVKQDDGTYKDGPEERTEVSVNKVFHTETRMTTAEARAGKGQAEFYDAWVARNKDTVVDKRTIKDGAGGTAVTKGAPQAGGNTGTGAPAKSLFGNKG